MSLSATEHAGQKFPILYFAPSRLSLRALEPDLRHLEVTANSIGRSPRWQAPIIHGWRPFLMKKLQFLSCSSRSVIEHALTLVGHDGEKHAVLSSSNGQVTYPTILEIGAASWSGYLQLSCIPGSIRWQGMIIGTLVSKERSYYGPSQQDSIIYPRPVCPQLGIDYVSVPTHHLPLIYTLSLRDQQEPPSKFIHVEASISAKGLQTLSSFPQD